MMDNYVDQKNCFAICAPKRNFFISAPDNKIMSDWVEAIGSAGVKVKLPAMQGYLDKKGEWNSALQRRFFRTENAAGKNILNYYEKSTEDSKGSIELDGAEVSIYSAGHLQIKVKNKKRTYVLKAETDELRDDWIAALKEIAKGSSPVERMIATEIALGRKPAIAVIPSASGATGTATNDARAAATPSITEKPPEIKLQGLPVTHIDTYYGSCLCGKCRIQCIGKPIFAGFCHCSLCSKYGNTDRSLICGFPKDKFTISDGKDSLTSYQSSEKATRYFCSNCGTGVYTDSGGFFGCSPSLFGVDDAYRLPPNLLPQVHIYYGSSCLLGVVKDGGQLALYNDVPKTFGGSGETIQE